MANQGRRQILLKTKFDNRDMRIWLQAAAGLLLAGMIAWPAVTGSISGTVSDASGAVIAGVNVTATNTAQGYRQQNNHGHQRLLQLSPARGRRL